MVVFAILLLAITIIGVRFCGKGTWNNEYLSKETTNIVNGFFVAMVFLRHIKTYMAVEGTIDTLFVFVDSFLGQLIILSFLFYSGYGMMKSYLRIGNAYIKSFPKTKIFKIWYHFAFAVCLFLIVNIGMGRTSYGIIEILLSFVAWCSIGNSNWYVFAVLCSYLFIFVSFSIYKNSPQKAIASFFLLCTLYCGILYVFKPEHWYSTIYIMPLGMLYAYKQQTFECFIKKRWGLLTCGLVVSCVILWVVYSKYFPLLFLPLSVLATFFILCITMKLRLKNKVLSFLGKYTFEIYILQRIPMILLQNQIKSNLVYVFSCFAGTLIIAVLFNSILHLLDKRMIGEKNGEQYEKN